MHFSTISGAGLLALAAFHQPALAAPGQSDANVLVKRGFGIPLCIPGAPLDGGSCIDFIQHLQRRSFIIQPSTEPRVINNGDIFPPPRTCFISWTKPKNPLASDLLASAAEFCFDADLGCKTDCQMAFTNPLNSNLDLVRLCMSTGRPCTP